MATKFLQESRLLLYRSKKLKDTPRYNPLPADITPVETLLVGSYDL